jgi:mono/diheme cytochrome c family protein
MKRCRKTIGVLTIVLFAATGGVRAHDPNATITWNREISRIIYDRCASCHRPDGTSFSLMTYQDAQPRAAAIKNAVLARRMPPWGAVKGFGDFRNDQGLTQEQISLITTWVETGSLRGNNPNALPPIPKFEAPAPSRTATMNGIVVSGDYTVQRDLTVEGLLPSHVPAGSSIQVVAILPNGAIQPLLWLYEYKDSYRHPFLYRRPVKLPTGTLIRGVPRDMQLLLMDAAHSAAR